VGAGADLLLRPLPRWARAVVALPGLALAGVLLVTGERIAFAHGLAWERVTHGPADTLARRIDGAVGAQAEGVYEIGGPMIAVYRRAPARFAYSVPNFFEADVSPKAVPELLERGNGFVVTPLTLNEWLEQRVGDRTRAARFRAALTEPGRTVIVAASRQ